MNKKVIIGFVSIAIGLIGFFWAQNHAPQSDLANMLMNKLQDTFTLNKDQYTVSMVVSVLLVVFGAYQIFRK